MIPRSAKREVRAEFCERHSLNASFRSVTHVSGSPRHDMDAGRSQAANVQFPRNRREGQNVVIAVWRLLLRKLFVFLSYDIVASLVSQEIALGGRLLIVGQDARLETGMSGFNVAETVVKRQR